MDIISENRLPGTDAWKITNPVKYQEIEGFASATSVNHGARHFLSLSLTMMIDYY